MNEEMIGFGFYGGDEMNHIFGRLAIGTAAWGREYNGAKVSEDDQKRILDYCQCSGIDMIDTATAYEWDWTKVSSYFDVVVKVREGDDIEAVKKAEPYCIMAHDKNTHDVDSLRYYKRGVSMYEDSNVPKAKDDVIQVPYSIYDRRFASIIVGASQFDTEIHVRSIFLRGKLLKKFKPWECIVFCLMNPNIDRVIIGVDSFEQLKDNLRPFHRMCGAEIHDEEILDPRKWKK